MLLSNEVWQGIAAVSIGLNALLLVAVWVLHRTCQNLGALLGIEERVRKQRRAAHGKRR